MGRAVTRTISFMKKIIFVLSFALAAVSVFAYTEAKENEKLAYALSGQYAKKMADASEKLNELDQAVKQTLLFNESEGSKKARENIWRLSSDIRSSVASLPLDPSFSGPWMNYLGRLGNYAKDAESMVDHKKYYTVMSKASKNLENLTSDWQTATAGLVEGNYTMDHWKQRMDSSNPDFDWGKMSASVKEYSESDFPLTASESDAMKKKDLKNLDDQKISKETAVERFKDLFPMVSNEVVHAEESMPESPYPFYHIRFADGDTVGYVDVTEKGGHVLSYLADRNFKKGKLTFEDTKERAESFLKRAGYDDVVYEEARENDTSWHFVYVRVEPFYKAKVFSDTLHVKVAKDNGDIVGLNAAEYIRKEHTERQEMKKIDWADFFHSDVTIVKNELAYVENESLKQRLSYYLTVTRNEHGDTGTYRVIVDAENGEVIKTERLR